MSGFSHISEIQASNTELQDVFMRPLVLAFATTYRGGGGGNNMTSNTGSKISIMYNKDLCGSSKAV